MECSICYSQITSATGKVQLSCSHQFHFSCLTTWFDRQKCEGSHENCPLCRHQSTDFEKLPDAMYEEDGDEDEDEDEDEEDDDSWEEMPSLDELAAEERASGRFQRLKSTKSPEELQLYAATLIKACWRGYQDRLLYLELLENKEMIERHENYISNVQKHLHADIQRRKFLNSTVGLSRYEVKMMAAKKIQLTWSMFKKNSVLKTIITPRIWREISPRVWERIVMNPEEDEPILFVGLAPPSEN